MLKSQSQTRTSIIGHWTAFDAQKQFMVLFEAAIIARDDLSKTISCYQDSLKFARSKLDFVLGESLYMI